MTDEELIGALRTEYKTAFDELSKATGDQMEAKLAQFKDVESKLNAAVDKKLADEVAARDKKIDEADAKWQQKFTKFLQEQNARFPLASGDPAHKSLGAQFVESEAYKTANSGRVHGRHDHFGATFKQSMVPKLEQKVITEAGSGFVLFPQRVGIFPQPAVPLVIRPLFDAVALGATNAVEYLVEAYTNNADYQVTEGAKKAESLMTWTEKTANVRTIAHFVKVSRQMLADVPVIEGIINSRLIYGVLKKEEQELLTGDNSAGHLHGVLPQATLLAGTVVGSNFMDEIMKAITAVGVAGYTATNVVVNPADWGEMAIQKNDQGFYVLGGPQVVAGQRLWGLPLAVTPAIPAKTALVGQFPGTAMIFDRETATVDIAYENEDDFVKNLVCLRAEERLAFAVFAPAAYVKVVKPLTL